MVSSRPHPVRYLLAAALAGALLLLGTAGPAAAASPCQGGAAVAEKSAERQTLRATLCLVNAERGRRGLRRLRTSDRLSAAARRHARDMVRHRYFSHVSRSGASFVERIRRTGYLRSARRWAVGENLAWGSGERSTPRSIVRAWMESPGHRANILAPSFREIGIGLALGAPADVTAPAATYATSFGARN